MGAQLIKCLQRTVTLSQTSNNVLNFMTFSLSIYLLVACSTVTPPQKSALIISPDAGWWKAKENEPFLSIATDSSLGINLPLVAEKNLAVVRRKMSVASSADFVLVISDSRDINAFAQTQNNKNYIIFTQAFLIKYGNDPDVLATSLGHELAHHELGHTVPGYIEDRNNAVNILGQTMATISNFFLPFSGLLVGNIVKGVGLSYSRADERAADNLGMSWAKDAGYSPCGSYRLASSMNQMEDKANFSFLSTHPGSEERMENASNFAMHKNLTSCHS